jgi:hypothetical protein
MATMTRERQKTVLLAVRSAFDGIPEPCEERAALDLAIAALGGGWRPIEEAPKGGGAEMRTDPKWVDPPKVLLLFADGSQSAGYWDWYYAEGGRGYRTGVSAWIEPVSGEQLAMHYDEPTHFHPLPPSPQGETK